jgi:hypothetical protein
VRLLAARHFALNVCVGYFRLADISLKAWPILPDVMPLPSKARPRGATKGLSVIRCPRRNFGEVILQVVLALDGTFWIGDMRNCSHT